MRNRKLKYYKVFMKTPKPTSWEIEQVDKYDINVRYTDDIQALKDVGYYCDVDSFERRDEGLYRSLLVAATRKVEVKMLLINNLKEEEDYEGFVVNEQHGSRNYFSKGY